MGRIDSRVVAVDSSHAMSVRDKMSPQRWTRRFQLSDVALQRRGRPESQLNADAKGLEPWVTELLVRQVS
jgi:hypothetical protein